MIRRVALVLWLCCASARADDVVRIAAPAVMGVPSSPLDPQLVARERLLSGHLDALAERSRWRGLSLGVLFSFGSVLVALGAAYPYGAGPFFIPFGSHALVRGIMVVSATDNPGPHRDRYAALPMHDDAQLRARLAHGERSLGRLADQFRRIRIADGVVSLVVAASYIPLRYGMSRLRDDDYRFGDDVDDYLISAVAVLEAGAGVMRFFEPSHAETARDDYAKRTASQPRLSWAVAPSATGAAFGARLRF